MCRLRRPTRPSTSARSSVVGASRSDREPFPNLAGQPPTGEEPPFPSGIDDRSTAFVADAALRNPSRATPNSLRIAYENDAGAWASLQVDFLVISRRDDGTLGASIVDPHGDYLADAKAKLLALADFAEAHGDSFVRIVSITGTGDGSLRLLDLKEPDVRAGVRAFTGGKVTAIYEGALSLPYG